MILMEVQVKNACKISISAWTLGQGICTGISCYHERHCATSLGSMGTFINESRHRASFLECNSTSGHHKRHSASFQLKPEVMHQAAYQAFA